jgi:hypothetical protein
MGSLATFVIFIQTFGEHNYHYIFIEGRATTLEIDNVQELWGMITITRKTNRERHLLLVSTHQRIPDWVMRPCQSFMRSHCEK